ncbi:MAG: tRNA dihydrouridine(20/20a) synthase DusA [Pseudanabaenaceae cyanobacterium bins.39]|nr:tRNA dihydrouridine(20/20a) synthase DusA [Pseudanabaenaceae cyanobacterium bins.39]
MVYPISIAPMMDRTDRHYRYFMRQITKRTLLYTEMVTSAAIMHGDRNYLMGFSPEEKPLVLQVGGDRPADLAECARIAEAMGYDAINLNVGCPSDRVQSGNFGACLMKNPAIVAQCVAAMIDAVKIPVSVKHRIGVDDLDSYDYMRDFVKILADAGCRHFSVHARKAWLQGLSPKENREVPPLRYGDVHRLKQEFPDLWIEINGGFTHLEQVQEQLDYVDGVMIGRAAYDHPYLFAEVDRQFFGSTTPIPSQIQVAEAMIEYVDRWTSQGLKLHKISRHMLQLFHGMAGSRLWKRILTEKSCLAGADSAVIREAIAAVLCQN